MQDLGATTAHDGPPAPLRSHLAVVSTVDAIVNDLRHRVLVAEHPSGSRLKESVLAQQYGVSRHTVRAALTRLTSAGLLEFGANRGWSVRTLSREDFLDIALLRVALEAQAVREIAAAGGELGPAAQGALDEMLAVGGDGSWEALLEVDMRFHRELVERAGSPRLSAAYGDVQAALHLYLAQRRDWFAQRPTAHWKWVHLELVRSIASGDPDLAERAVREQFSYVDDLVAHC